MRPTIVIVAVLASALFCALRLTGQHIASNPLAAPLQLLSTNLLDVKSIMTYEEAATIDGGAYNTGTIVVPVYTHTDGFHCYAEFTKELFEHEKDAENPIKIEEIGSILLSHKLLRYAVIHVKDIDALLEKTDCIYYLKETL